jgi:hypothetical protein
LDSSNTLPSRTDAEEFTLGGPSDLPDPQFNAYRADLADVALAGRVIASHYARPIERTVAKAAALRSHPSDGAEAVVELKPGDPFSLLDDTLGWSWGYAGADRRVGYVRSDAISAESYISPR